jgi:lysozyme family protein
MEYTDRFNNFIPVILKHEGGYVNDPDDAGGETNMGISKRAFPHLDIKNLTVEETKQLYYIHYYQPLNITTIENELLALHIFDMAVNAGNKRAVILLQQVLGLYHTDGIIGPVTLRAVKEYKGDLLGEYIKARTDYYTAISKNGNNIKFLPGWLHRVENTKLES